MEIYKVIIVTTLACMIWVLLAYIFRHLAELRKAPFRRSIVQEQLGKDTCTVAELGAALAEFEEQFERFEKKFDKLAEKLEKENK